MTYAQLKAKIKDLASRITNKKKEYKAFQREHNGSGGSHTWDLYQLKHDFRHHHVAASLLRGKTMEQIESNSRFDRPWQQRYSDDTIKGILESIEPREKSDETVRCDAA